MNSVIWEAKRMFFDAKKDNLIRVMSYFIGFLSIIIICVYATFIRSQTLYFCNYGAIELPLDKYRIRIDVFPLIILPEQSALSFLQKQIHIF